MKKLMMLAAAAVVAMAGAASAAEHEVKMLNKGEKGAMVFEPDFLNVEVGDTVKFLVVDKGHDAQAIKGMFPEGVEEFKGKINQEVTFTVEKEGVYGIKCTPHYAMGMVMLVVAGEPVNAEAAKAVKQPGKAKQVFADLFAQLEQ
ncbi:MAG: pseudoazurin [Aquamicrobium sp.]|jgi:pseudoazurin|uniref:pseudoazurin n=1 Tax=Aquamicrobium sp. TaxID=1872579 RepID=UPI00349EDFD3|nr:pseudoazurin [Aquamicrobium sp.]